MHLTWYLIQHRWEEARVEFGRSVHFVAAVLAVISIMAMATGAQAQDCRNYEDYLCWKPGAELPVFDYSYRNDVDGTSAQLSVVYEDAGFFLFDLADPEDPTIYGPVSPYGGFTSVVKDGDHSWVADADSGLVVINALDWNSMYVQVVENVPAYDIAMTHDLILVAGKEGGFSTCAHDVDKPTLQYTIGMPGDAMAVSADPGERYAYVACWDAGLCVVDLETTPPSIVATMDTLTYALSTCVVDTILYLGVQNYGAIEKINISDPLNPVHMESCGSIYTPLGISWVDDHLYTTNFHLTILLDPPNEEQMQVVETVNLQGYGTGGGVIAFDDYCYIPTKGRSPNWDGGLDIIKKPTHGFRNTHHMYDVASNAVDLVARGDYAYVLDYGGGVIVVDLTDGSVVDEDWYGGMDFYSIELWGDYLLVTEEYYGLVVFEIVTDDDIEYLSDISLPDDGCLDVVARGQYAYVAAHRKVQIVDLSTPSSPSWAGEIDDFGYEYVHAVDVSGDILYVAVKSSEGYLSVSAYDLDDNPIVPQLLSVVEIVGLDAYSENVKAAGHMVYLTGPAGLLITDFYDPENPVVKSLLRFSCDNSGLCVSGDWVYAGSAADGVRVIDASDPGNPAIVGHISTQMAGSDEASNMLVHGDDVLFVGWDSYLLAGFRQCDDILDVPEWPGDIARATLSQNYPNPFNPTTIMSYTLEIDGHVTLDIYDPAGRYVTTLIDGTRTAGKHFTVWDGTKSDGQKVAGGVYFARLSTEAGEAVRKMVLLK